MKYFDLSPMVGPHFAPRLGRHYTIADLLDELDWFGIDEALVYHGLAREYDFSAGNSVLLDSIKDVTRLHACWVVGLHHTGTLPQPNVFVQTAISAGVEAVRLFFGGLLSDSSCLDVFAYSELFAELEKYHMPTIFEFEGVSGISVREIIELDAILIRFPHLPVILTASRFTGVEIRSLFPRLEKFENLHLATCGLQTNCLIEDIAVRFGHEKLIFATNLPWFGGGQAKIALAYANISDSAKQAIAYGNLRQMIKGISK